MQHATIMTQVFLGVQLKCASCHDSFIDHWKLADAWGMASALGNQRFEIFRCQQSTGKLAEPQFLFPELGTIDPAADKSTRRQQVAELMTTPRNGLFARTIVNRLWARLFGRGLIEPLDEMLVHSAWHPELLEWLSGELVRNDFKLDKIHVQRRIDQMTQEGVEFKTGIEIGKDLKISDLRKTFDALLLAIGAQHTRKLEADGHDLKGVHYAMDYLPQRNREVAEMF